MMIQPYLLGLRDCFEAPLVMGVAFYCIKAEDKVQELFSLKLGGD